MALITAIKATTMNTPNNRSSSTADEKQDKSKGVSSSEFNSTFQIYGKDSTGNMMDLPVWMQECATKVTIEHYKSIIIKKFVMSKKIMMTPTFL